MKADLRLIGRLYCALIALLLIALGFSIWHADRDRPYLGAMLCGTGAFMAAGLFGLCVAVALLSFAFSLGLLLLHGEVPGTGTWSVWAIEIVAGGVAAVLARQLYRDVVG
ncbi:MAG: hypothetical protein NVS9B10_05030 [Nevskia sp.]